MTRHKHRKKVARARRRAMTIKETFVALLICAGLTGAIIGASYFLNQKVLPVPVEIGLSVAPTQGKIFQGDPVEIILSGTTSPTYITKATLAGPAGTSILHFAPYQGSLISVYGAALQGKTGTYTVTLFLEGGEKMKTTFAIVARPAPQEYLAVPEQLGGNSVANQQRVVSVLSQENSTLKNMPSNVSVAFWSTPFRLPLEGPVTVTDKYGILRNSGAAVIPHEGTDFAAPPGTPVYAINRGIVRLAQNLQAYGNTVVIDHGLSVESLYMHLSRVVVTPGASVSRGQLVGYSGETGYSEGPHLHLSIKINGISIDPMKFLTLFSAKP